MRLLKVAALCVAMMASGMPAYAAPPVFNGSVVDAPPAPATGSTFYFAGDSITYGLGVNSQGTNGCAFYTYPSPCFADQLSSFYNATEVNDGTRSQCLEATTTTGSLCNSSSSGVTPLINSYTSTLLPFAGNNKNWFWIMIGTNDVACVFSCGSESSGDTQIAVATYKANLSTIVSALEGAGTSGGQIVLSEIPAQNAIGYTLANTFSLPALIYSFNAAIADVAVKYHTRMATTYRAMGQCIPNPSTQANPCLYDGVHPNNTGHANLAAEDEQANFINAQTSRAAYVANGLLNTVQVVTNPYNAQLNVNLWHTTGTAASLYGPLNAYNELDFGTAATGVNGYAKFQTANSAILGVTGDCWSVATGTSTQLFALNCSTGNIAFSGAVRSGAHNACSATTGVPCESTAGTCSLSASTSCTFTVTVPASSSCIAQGNASDTTTGAEWFKTSLSTNTLTVTANVASSQTSTVAANVNCL